MSKTKVVIVTRSYDYFDKVDEKEPIKGRELLCQAINNEKNGVTSFSDGKTALIRFFKEKNEVDGWGDNILGKAREHGITIPTNVSSKGEEYRKKYAITELVKKNSDDTEKRCYVQIVNEKYDVILLLWNIIDAEDCKIEPFDMFIEAICKDCGIEEKADDKDKAILYIHDHQFGISGNETILPNDNYEGNSYYGTIKKYFCRVLAFQHSTASVYFNDILKFAQSSEDIRISNVDTGDVVKLEVESPCEVSKEAMDCSHEQTTELKAEQIGNKENTCTSFMELRQEADLIIKSK